MRERIIKERERLGLTPVELSKRLKKSYEMIRQYENGKSLPGALVLEKMADIGMDVQYLITGIPTAGVAEERLPYGSIDEEPDPLARQKRAVKQLIDDTEDGDLLADIQTLVDALKKQRARRG